MNTFKIILLILFVSIIIGCKKNNSKPFTLSVETYDKVTKEPIAASIIYSSSWKGGPESCTTFAEKGLEISGELREKFQLTITSEGHEEKIIEIGPGKTVKKFYLKKINKNTNN